MKKSISLLVVCCLSLTCFAKDDEPIGRINSVQEQSGENTAGEDIEILKVNTIQSGGTFKGALRVSILLEDKNDQLAWGMAQKDQPTGEVQGGQYKGASATGAVAWRFEAGNPELKRPKTKAYTVQYGYVQNGEFIVLDEEIYKTDGFNDLMKQNKDAIRLKTRLTYIWWVE